MVNDKLKDMQFGEDFDKWVKSWWEEHSRPKNLRKGQIWTVFHPDSQPEKPGTMVCVFSVDPGGAFVVPLHSDLDAITGCEPILTETTLSSSLPLVGVVELGMLIHSSAFESARFIGELKKEAMDRLEHAFSEFRKVVKALTRLQTLEARLGPNRVPDEEINKAFEAGILRLVSAKVSYEELVRFHDSLQANLQIYHDKAIGSFVFEKVKAPLPEKLKKLLERLKQLGSYVCPVAPEPAVVAAGGPGIRHKELPELQNPLEIEVEFPEKGEWLTLIPPPFDSEKLRKLEEHLKFFREQRFSYTIQAWGEDDIWKKQQAIELPESEGEGRGITIASETTAILVAFGLDKKELDKVLEFHPSDKTLPEPGILWVLYRPEHKVKE